jgi:N-acetylglucosaminyldiphosphoundecaprenol N-acetyl-beta-D-mannosaminyltransferase
MKRIYILDVPIDDVTENEAVKYIDTLMNDGQLHQVVTVNPEFVMEAQRDPRFMQVLNDASLATADGVGIVLAARWLGTPIRERVAKQAVIRGWRIFFLGAAPGVAEKAAQVLRHRYAGLQVAGTYAGSPSIIEEPYVQQQVLDANPDILLVAYGHPAQDLWIARNQALLNVRLAIGVGGTFDEITGLVPQAPNWMHKVGLKWLWRLIQQPWRYKRIFTALIKFPLAVLFRRSSTNNLDSR